MEAWKPWADKGAVRHRFTSHQRGYGKLLNDTLWWLDENDHGAEGFLTMMDWFCRADGPRWRQMWGAPPWFRRNIRDQGDLETLTRRQKLPRRINLARSWAESGSQGDPISESTPHRRKKAKKRKDLDDDALRGWIGPRELLSADEQRRLAAMRGDG